MQALTSCSSGAEAAGIPKITRLPILANAMPRVEDLLSQKPTCGDFGEMSDTTLKTGSRRERRRARAA